jgi:hypothetical protein
MVDRVKGDFLRRNQEKIVLRKEAEILEDQLRCVTLETQAGMKILGALVQESAKNSQKFKSVHNESCSFKRKAQDFQEKDIDLWRRIKSDLQKTLQVMGNDLAAIKFLMQGAIDTEFTAIMGCCERALSDNHNIESRLNLLNEEQLALSDKLCNESEIILVAQRDMELLGRSLAAHCAQQSDLLSNQTSILATIDEINLIMPSLGSRVGHAQEEIASVEKSAFSAKKELRIAISNLDAQRSVLDSHTKKIRIETLRSARSQLQHQCETTSYLHGSLTEAKAKESRVIDEVVMVRNRIKSILCDLDSVSYKHNHCVELQRVEECALEEAVQAHERALTGFQDALESHFVKVNEKMHFELELAREDMRIKQEYAASKYYNTRLKEEIASLKQSVECCKAGLATECLQHEGFLRDIESLKEKMSFSLGENDLIKKMLLGRSTGLVKLHQGVTKCSELNEASELEAKRLCQSLSFLKFASGSIERKESDAFNAHIQYQKMEAELSGIVRLSSVVPSLDGYDSDEVENVRNNERFEATIKHVDESFKEEKQSIESLESRSWRLGDASAAAFVRCFPDLDKARKIETNSLRNQLADSRAEVEILDVALSDLQESQNVGITAFADTSPLLHDSPLFKARRKQISPGQEKDNIGQTGRQQILRGILPSSITSEFESGHGAREIRARWTTHNEKALVKMCKPVVTKVGCAVGMTVNQDHGLINVSPAHISRVYMDESPKDDWFAEDAFGFISRN